MEVLLSAFADAAQGQGGMSDLGDQDLETFDRILLGETCMTRSQQTGHYKQCVGKLRVDLQGLDSNPEYL